MNRAYEVFISFKKTSSDGKPTRDGELAEEIHRMLSSRGVKVFFSESSLETLGVSAFQDAIDLALDEAVVLVVVATSPRHLDSQWVKYEWDSFMHDVLIGLKPEGRVFPYIEGFHLAALPRPLRRCQTFLHGPQSLGSLFNFISRAVGSTESGKRLEIARALEEAMSDLSEATHAARWLGGWEYLLWDFAIRNPFGGPLGFNAMGHDPDAEDIALVMQLSMRCQGWIIFDDTHGTSWVSIEDWYWHLFDPKNRSLDGKILPLH